MAASGSRDSFLPSCRTSIPPLADLSHCIGTRTAGRDYNQDNAAILPFLDTPKQGTFQTHGGFLILCDGHGDRGDGEIAAAAATESLLRQLAPYSFTTDFTDSFLSQAFANAHDDVLRAYKKRDHTLQVVNVHDVFGNLLPTSWTSTYPHHSDLSARPQIFAHGRRRGRQRSRSASSVSSSSSSSSSTSSSSSSSSSSSFSQSASMSLSSPPGKQQQQQRRRRRRRAVSAPPLRAKGQVYVRSRSSAVPRLASLPAAVNPPALVSFPDFGTTATLCIFQPLKRRITFAHVGDSEACVVLQDAATNAHPKVYRFCQPHQMQNAEERKRILTCIKQHHHHPHRHHHSSDESQQQRVLVATDKHVFVHPPVQFPPTPSGLHKSCWQRMEPTRSLGHSLFQHFGVHPQPEIKTFHYKKEKSVLFLLLASDGFWNLLPDLDRSPCLVRSIQKTKHAVEYVQLALAYLEQRYGKRHDNTTFAVFRATDTFRGGKSTE